MSKAAEADLLDLAGRVALVTGAGQGVGRQIALQLAQHGSAGVVVNDYFLERAESVAAEIEALGGNALAVQADVADLGSVRAMADRVQDAFGSVGILVNNAGNMGPVLDPETLRPFWETNREIWDKIIGVNFYGVINTATAFVPSMIERNAPGRVITIISDAARYGDAGGEVYAGAKAGAAGFMRSLARDLGRYGITANNISISGMMTEATADLLTSNPDRMKKTLSKYIVRRFGEPSDVANMALFLASEASSWITGQTYPVNGGFTL
jgi:2-hydroxycyclohexanecarboxyl-CoA dehydrogenase